MLIGMHICTIGCLNKTRGNLSVNDSFLNPRRSKETCDIFLIRHSILNALNRAMKSSAGTLLDIGSGTAPYRSFILENSNVTRYIALDLPTGK
jgi:hypothetical protein